jgi:hypothetical protein
MLSSSSFSFSSMDVSICTRIKNARECKFHMQISPSFWLLEFNNQTKTRVKSLIPQYTPIIEHFSIFSSFLNQIEWFFGCHWMCKLEDCKCFFPCYQSLNPLNIKHPMSSL